MAVDVQDLLIAEIRQLQVNTKEGNSILQKHLIADAKWKSRAQGLAIGLTMYMGAPDIYKAITNRDNTPKKEVIYKKQSDQEENIIKGE